MNLQLARFGSCLRKAGDRYWTYSGLGKLIEKKLGFKIVNKVTPLKFSPVPWYKAPPPMRWYQKAAMEALLNQDKGIVPKSVSMGTGTGKSLIMGNLARETGLSTVVVVPTLSIANQMLENFTKWFGKGKTGSVFRT